jgi:hypothetical protein
MVMLLCNRTNRGPWYYVVWASNFKSRFTFELLRTGPDTYFFKGSQKSLIRDNFCWCGWSMNRWPPASLLFSPLKAMTSMLDHCETWNSVFNYNLQRERPWPLKHLHLRTIQKINYHSSLEDADTSSYCVNIIGLFKKRISVLTP